MQDMKKFFVLYRVPVEVMAEWKKNTSPEEMKAQSEAMGEKMMAWMAKNEKSIVDKGLPLGKNTRLTAAGAEAVSNDLNYYTVVEAESPEDVAQMFKENPHLDIPGAYLDVMEVPHVGM